MKKGHTYFLEFRYEHSTSSITDFFILQLLLQTFFYFSFLRKKVAFHIVGTHVLGDWICLPVPTQMAKTQFRVRGGRGRTKFQANSTFPQRSWEEEEGRKERKSWLLYLKLHLGTTRKWTHSFFCSKKTRPPFFLKSEKNTLVYAFLMFGMWTAFW